MIVEGGGLLGRALREADAGAAPGVVFARGAADSTLDDDAAFNRELEMLAAAMERAAAIRIPLVYYSSATVYGRFGSEPVREDQAPGPVTPYGRHKTACEALLLRSRQASLILRLPNVVGPGGHPNQLVPSLVRQVLAGRVTVESDAGRDILGVDEVVEITRKLLESELVATYLAGPLILNVASGICTPVAVLVDEMQAILGAHAEVDVRAGGQHQRFDTSRLREMLELLPFDTAYPTLVLRRYVPIIAKVSVLGDADPVRPAPHELGSADPLPHPVGVTAPRTRQISGS